MLWSKQYLDQVFSFYYYYQKVWNDQEMEDIHQLRVNIKELRAQWSLAEMAGKGAWQSKACRTLTRTLFKSAGKMRECQINLEILNKTYDAGLQSYRGFLHNKIECHRIDLLRIIENFNRLQFEALNLKLTRFLKDLTETEILDATKAYCNQINSSILSLSGENRLRKNLHTIRKLLKAKQKVMEMTHTLWPDESDHMAYKSIKKLNHKIGQWHDYSVLTKSIHKHLKDHSEIGKSSIESYSLLNSKFLTREEKVIRNIRKFINAMIEEKASIRV